MVSHTGSASLSPGASKDSLIEGVGNAPVIFAGLLWRKSVKGRTEREGIGYPRETVHSCSRFIDGPNQRNLFHHRIRTRLPHRVLVLCLRGLTERPGFRAEPDGREILLILGEGSIERDRPTRVLNALAFVGAQGNNAKEVQVEGLP